MKLQDADIELQEYTNKIFNEFEEVINEATEEMRKIFNEFEEDNNKTIKEMMKAVNNKLTFIASTKKMFMDLNIEEDQMTPFRYMYNNRLSKDIVDNYYLGIYNNIGKLYEKLGEKVNTKYVDNVTL